MQLGDARAQQGFVKAVIKTSLTTNPLKLQSLASTKKYFPCCYFNHYHSCNKNLYPNKSFEVTIPSQHQKIFAMLLFSPPPRSLHHLLLALHAVLAGSDLKRWLIETEREWHGRWKPFRRGVREVAIVEEVSSGEEPKDRPCLYYTHRRSFLSPTHCFWVGEVAFVEEVSSVEEPEDLLFMKISYLLHQRNSKA